MGRPTVHLTAFEQATGEASFVDDIPTFSNELHLAPVLSTRATGKVAKIDFEHAKMFPGVVAVFSAANLGDEKNEFGLGGVKDERVFHSKEARVFHDMVTAVKSLFKKHQA